MKNYYSGPKKKIIATLNSNNEQDSHNYTKNIKVIEQNVLFYYNIFGTLVEKENGFPTIRAEELPDLIEFDLKNGHNRSEICFVDEKDLKRVKQSNTSKHNKILQKIKRNF